MKTIIAALLLTCFSIAGVSQSGVTKDNQPPFRLEITANGDRNHSTEWDFVNNAETAVKSGSIIEIAIRKTNLGNREISKWALLGQTIDVHDSSGNLLAPRPREEQRATRGGGGQGMLRGSKDMFLQPGESSVHPSRLSDGYDLSQPGTYTVQISEHISSDPTSDLVRSNVITILVTPNAESVEP